MRRSGEARQQGDHKAAPAERREQEGPGKRPVLIPFSETAVLEIDLESGKILIDPRAAGLIDDPKDQIGRPPKPPGKSKD